MNPMISIIIPVYNTKPLLLQRLFQSLSIALREVNDPFPLDIIIIDDGSSSRDTIEFLNNNSNGALPYNLIQTLNNGRSNARNLGLIEARGKFVLFLDSDDQVEKSYFDVLQSSIDIFRSCDFISFGYKINSLNVYRTKNFWSGEDVTYKNDKYFSICSSVFLTEFLHKHQIRFDSSLSHGEDIDFIKQCLSNALESKHINEIIYRYNYDFKSHELESRYKKALRPIYFQLKYRLNSVFKSKKITSNV